MNHIPYEDWLLSDEELDPSQKAELQEHLAGCEACRALVGAWQSVAVTIQNAGEMAPAPGFTDRWHERLLEERVARQRRWTWLILAICLGGALASLAALLWPLAGNLPSGVVILTNLLHGVSQLFSTGKEFLSAGSEILGRLPLGVSLLVWIGATTTLCFWTLIWFTFVWRAPQLRRNYHEIYH